MKKFNSRILLFLVVSVSQYMLSSCIDRDRLDHVQAFGGQIIIEDGCSYKGKKAYIVDLDMASTFAPKEIKISLTSDTIDGIRYNNLVRVFANLEAPDSLLYKYRLNTNLNPVNEKCSTSRFKIQSFEASGEYGFSKVN